MTNTKPSSSDLSNLQTDVALLKQFNEKVAEPTFKDIQGTQKEIKEALVNLDHVKQKEFDEYKLEIDHRFKEANRRRLAQTILTGVASALIASLLTYVILGWIKK